MKTIIVFVLAGLITSVARGQEKEAYHIFNANGKKVTYEKMLKSLKSADIVLFGELHNNPISHWFEYELAVDLSKGAKLTLGAEMFEADNQQAVNDYLSGKIDAKGLDSLARLWPNYKTDYAPLLNLAKEQHLNFVATDIPRRFASLVYKNGFEALDSLSNEEKEWIAPLPVKYDAELPWYKDIVKAAEGHGGPNLPKAQAIKDATMAYFILANYVQGTKFLHFDGAYHSDNYGGIVWYLKQSKPDIHYMTITTVSQEDNNHLSDDNLHKADFIICVDEHMTPTY